MGLVIYEMHIGSFNNLTSTEAGTFYSAVEKLDELQYLGVNVVELLPVQESPGEWEWGRINKLSHFSF